MPVDRDPPDCLSGIAMDDCASRMCQARGLGHRLDRAGLVVGEHQRDQGVFRSVRQQALERGQRDNAAYRPEGAR